MNEKLQILKMALGAFLLNNEESLFFCPKCDHHKRKLSINIEKNVFKCWVCDYSGKSILGLMRKYETGENGLRMEFTLVQSGTFFETRLPLGVENPLQPEARCSFFCEHREPSPASRSRSAFRKHQN